MEKKLVTLVSVLITTIAEVGAPAPEGILYAGVMNDFSLDEFQKSIEILVRADCVTRSNNLVTITERGKKFAADIEETIRKPVSA